MSKNIAKKNTITDILNEHNTLNGFWFVLVEFIIVALVTICLGLLAIVRESLLWSIASFGVTINALTICATVIRQMRRGEQSGSIIQTYFGQEREAVRREHPNLGFHTLLLSVVTIIPFLLTVWILIYERSFKPAF